MGASPSMEEKKGFYLVCMGVTAEVETMGSGTWPECVLDGGHKGMSIGISKSSSVSPGV